MEISMASIDLTLWALIQPTEKPYGRFRWDVDVHQNVLPLSNSFLTTQQKPPEGEMQTLHY